MSTLPEDTETTNAAISPVNQFNGDQVSELKKSRIETGSNSDSAREAAETGRRSVSRISEIMYCASAATYDRRHPIRTTHYEYVPLVRLFVKEYWEGNVFGIKSRDTSFAGGAAPDTSTCEKQLGPFDPADFFKNRIHRTRFPARLTCCTKRKHRSAINPKISVASFTVFLATDSFGNATHNDEPMIAGFEAPATTNISLLEPEGTTEGWVHIEYRFLTWHYAHPLLSLPVCVNMIFGANTKTQWPAAPTFQSTRVVLTLDDFEDDDSFNDYESDTNFYDLDRWVTAPSIHRALIPATLSELACPGFNANGTQLFLPNAAVPNFHLEVQETLTGNWRDAKISSFTAIEDSTNYREELARKPQIWVGFEYRVIGWKAGSNSEG